MSGQSWIHCHCCNRRPSDDLKVFFISNCEILLCGNCKEIVRLKDCPKCKAKCEYFEINKNLPQRFMILFKDPMNYAKESVNQLKHLMKFQSFQRSSYDKTVSTKWQKAGQAVVVSKKRKPVDCSNLDALIKANKILRDELQKLKAIESNCKKHHEKDELSVGHYVTKEKMGTDTDSGLGSENSFTFITSTPKFESDIGEYVVHDFKKFEEGSCTNTNDPSEDLVTSIAISITMRVPNRTINFRLIFQLLAYSLFLVLAILIRQDLSEVRKQISETRNSDDFVDIYENGAPLIRIDPPLRTSIEEESLGVSMPKNDDDRKLITSQTYGIIAGGGLGNQLFELVSLLGIAKTTGRIPFLNPGNGALMQLLQTNILPRFDKLLDNFELKLMQPELYTHVIFNRMCCRYDPVERIAWYNSSVVHLQGVYFQSFKYFHKYRNSVRAWLTPHWLAMKRAQSLVPETSLKNFKICTHVRRGDFVSDGMHRPSDANFTHEATEYLVRKYQQNHPNISVVVLGNDPLWAQMVFAERMPQVFQMFPLFFDSVSVRKKSNLNYDITFAPTLTPEIDLAFSTQFCDSVLITAPSSTFGWWLGYLAKDKANVYYRDISQTSDQVLRQLEPNDFYPPEWIMLRSNQDSSIIFEGKGTNPFL